MRWRSYVIVAATFFIPRGRRASEITVSVT
jgi:hypothetical protein